MHLALFPACEGGGISSVAALVWFPDLSLKLRTDTRGRVWANDVPFGVAEHCIPPWALMRESRMLTSTCDQWIQFYVCVLPFIILFITYVTHLLTQINYSLWKNSFASCSVSVGYLPRPFFACWFSVLKKGLGTRPLLHGNEVSMDFAILCSCLVLRCVISTPEASFKYGWCVCISTACH